MNDVIEKTNDQLPAYINQDSNRGNENVGADDLQLPRLSIVQGQSPQLNKKKDEYIPGAEIGHMFNTLTGELYTDLAITPIMFNKRWFVWVNRKLDSNGGLRGIFDTEEEAAAFLSKEEDSEKLEIVLTGENLCLLDDGSEIVLSMAKSKMKVQRKWNSLVKLQGNDRFSRRYIISTCDDQNSKGEEFKNFTISAAGFPSQEVYEKASNMYEMISGGSMTYSGDYSNETGAETEY